MTFEDLELRMSVDEDNSNCKTFDKPRDPERTRELFGVQLEVSKPIILYRFSKIVLGGESYAN